MTRSLSWLSKAVVCLAVALIAAPAFADPGAIWTSKDGCSIVNANVQYESKQEVYLNGGPAGNGSNGLPAGNYWVRVTAPGGGLLGKSLTANAVVDSTGRFVACYKIWDLVYFPDGITPGFADTTNDGGEYSLDVSQDENFSPGTVKNDNFKVVCTNPETPVIAAPPAACSGSTGNIASVSNFNPSFQYSWSVTNGTITGGQGTASITFTAGASGTTVVSVTANNFSCSSSGGATVVIDDPPTLTATGGGTFCAGSTVTLTASGTNVDLSQAVWTDAGNNVVGNGATFSTSVAGTYTVTAPSTNSCAAPAAASQTIALDPHPTLSASGGGHYCDGSTATLTATGTNVDLANAVWTDAGNNVVGSGPTFSTSVAGTYTVTAVSTNTCPAPAAASQTVILDPHPTLSASGGGHYCDGTTVTLTATGTNVDLANAVWTDAGNNVVGSGPTFSTNVAGTYTVNAASTDACPAPAGASQTIVLDPPPTLSVSGNGTHICQGSSTTLTASGSNVDLANATWTLNGNPVGSGPTFTVPSTLAPGAYTYVVSATSTNSCGNPAPASATVTVDPTPTISIQGNHPFCDGGSITLTTNSSNVSGYQWSFNGTPISGQTSSSLVVTTAGTYSVVGTSANVCANPTDSVVVVVNPNPPAAPITAPSVVCAGSGKLKASTTANATTYSWAITNGTIVSGQGTSAITFTAGFDALHGVTISLTVTNSFGCSTASSVVVGNEACIEGCSLTQGAWGSSGGAGNAATELALICPSSCNPIVSGTGSKSFTLLGSVAEENCLVLRMPAGGTPAVLPTNGAGTTLFNLSNCGTTAVSGSTDLLLKNGKFNNVLLGQTITLALNVRQNSNLAQVTLCPTIKAQAVIHTSSGDVLNPGSDGILGTADDPITTISIPQSVLTKLGANNTVADLLALANTALGGGSIAPATLSDVNTAVNNINVGFDGCRIQINCLPVSTLSAAALRLAASEASIALCGISDEMPASLILRVRNRHMPADLQTLRDLSDLARDGHDVGIPTEELNRAIDAVNAAVANDQPLDGCGNRE